MAALKIRFLAVMVAEQAVIGCGSDWATPSWSGLARPGQARLEAMLGECNG